MRAPWQYFSFRRGPQHFHCRVEIELKVLMSSSFVKIPISDIAFTTLPLFDATISCSSHPYYSTPDGNALYAT